MIDDRRSLGMALSAPDFHLFQLPLDIADGIRSGEVMLALPQRAAPVAQTDAGETGEISVQLQQRVLDAPVRLDAILCRLSLPLSEVGRLAVGDVLSLPTDVLHEIAIEGVGRHPVATARLGRVDGMRALRLTAPGEMPVMGLDGDAPTEAVPPRTVAAPTPESAPRTAPPTEGDLAQTPPDTPFSDASTDAMAYALNEGPEAA